MNNLELKAIRMGLGLEVKQASEMVGVSKRNFQYYEKGQVKIPQDVAMSFENALSHYHLLMNNMLDDIASFYKENPKPLGSDYENSEEYFKAVENRKKLLLPLYLNFGDFVAKTGRKYESSWRLYQAVIDQLYINNKIDGLNDDFEIPHNFKIWLWFRGFYDGEI